MSIDFLINKFQTNRALPAMIWNNEYSSYGQLLELIESSRQELKEAHVNSGDVVALVSDYSPRCIAMLLALIEFDAIIVPLLSSILEEEKTSKFEIAGVTHVINIDPETDLGGVEQFPGNKISHPFYDELRKRQTCGLLLFSSGTSGKPKAALHDFSKLLEKFKIERKCLRTINFLMFDHWGGLNTLLYTLSNSGIVLTITDRRPEAVCAFVEKHKVELLPVSPSFLNLVILSEAYKRHDMSSLSLISYGTEPMPLHTLRQAKRIFSDVKFQQTYGLIELGVLRSKSRDDDSLWVKLGGEGFDLRIVDGILQIKAESAMLGYLNAHSPFTDDGYFITGDMALEEDGFFKILGRKSEIINVGGEKVYPQEVENTILSLDEIADATVFGEDNLIMGKIVSAKIVPRDSDFDKRTLIRKVKQHCKSTLQAFKVPVKIQIASDDLISTRLKKKRA